MDKFADRLRRDAENIEVTVSDELDSRISASLRGVTPQKVSDSQPRSRRPAMFWWASSLTGIVAAAVVIVIVNTLEPEQTAPPTPANVVAAVPVIDWKTETATLTGPLQEELNALQSDIKKAERKVREDIGL